jgi:hypothetical protein
MDGAVGEVWLESVDIPDEGIVGQGNVPKSGHGGGLHLRDEARKALDRALDGGDETFGFANYGAVDDVPTRRKGAKPGLDDTFRKRHDGDDEEGADIFKGVAHPEVIVEMDAGDRTVMVGGQGEQGRGVLEAAESGLAALFGVATMEQERIDG